MPRFTGDYLAPVAYCKHGLLKDRLIRTANPSSPPQDNPESLHLFRENFHYFSTKRSLAATVKEQAAQIQKVSAQLEVNKLPRKSFSTISKAAEPITQPNLAISGNASTRDGLFVSPRSPLFKIARLLVRLDHVASFIKYANHSVM